MHERYTLTIYDVLNTVLTAGADTGGVSLDPPFLGGQTKKFAAQYDRYFTFPACFNKTKVISSPDRPHRTF